MINSEFFRSRINEKFKKIETFAQTIGVSRQAVYDWLKHDSTPESAKLITIADALDLEEGEMDTLLGIPPTRVYFRKKGLSAPAPEVVSRSKELADTFFRISDNSYVVRDNTLFGVSNPDVGAVATYVRKLLSLETDEPVRLAELLLELRKHNVAVFFLPFEKLGLSFGSGTNREVAFTAKKGPQVIIFIDTRRTEDEALFDLCHELAHLILQRDDTETEDQEEERFCNKVAQELIYPERFLKLREEELAVFRDTQKYSWHAAVAAFRTIERELNWSPMGLAFALESHRLISKDSHAKRRLMSLHKATASKRRSVDSLLFEKFLPNNYSLLEEFFFYELDKQTEIYRPLIELRDAASFGKISSRRLAEVLNIDSGDADELVRSWISQREDIENQGDDAITG